MPTNARTTLASREDIEQHFADSIALLRSVRRTLTNLLDDAEDNPGVLKDIVLKQSELESALKRAFEAEERYNDWHARNSGVTNAAEIDFDTLRQDLACRLQSLRDCCQEEA